ncbi:MAG: transposase, partial [Candidatus Aminicenantes bacterium]|nr:transposase [Candidatus Aminicenantes bacterium]
RFFVELLMKAFNQDRLKFYGKISHLSNPESFAQLIKKCFNTEWVVYAKPPFGGAEKVLDYLGRYTHRIAISNNRLLRVKDGKVSFSWRNYQQENKVQTMTLEAEEFIRRFLLHVLPSGFMRIRYFGFLSNRHRTKKFKRCREIFHDNQIKEKSQSLDWKSRYEFLTGKPVDLCPFCHKGHLIPIQNLLPLRFPVTRPPPQTEINDNYINAF